MAISDRIGRICDSPSHCSHFETDHVSNKDTADEQTVMNQMDLFLNAAPDFEREVVKGPGMD